MQLAAPTLCAADLLAAWATKCATCLESQASTVFEHLGSTKDNLWPSNRNFGHPRRRLDEGPNQLPTNDRVVVTSVAERH